MAQDRELLAQCAAVNQRLGDIALVLMGSIDEQGRLPAAGLRQLAGHLFELAEQLQERADHIDNVIKGEQLPPSDR